MADRLTTALVRPDLGAGRLRVGVVDTAVPLTVFVGGASVSVPCGRLDSYVPVAGDRVALLADGADRLVLGSIEAVTQGACVLQTSTQTGISTTVPTGALANAGSAVSATLPDGWAEMTVEVDVRVAWTENASATELYQVRVVIDADNGPTISQTLTNGRAANSAQTHHAHHVLTARSAAASVQFQHTSAFGVGVLNALYWRIRKYRTG